MLRQIKPSNIAITEKSTQPLSGEVLEVTFENTGTDVVYYAFNEEANQKSSLYPGESTSFAAPDGYSLGGNTVYIDFKGEDVNKICLITFMSIGSKEFDVC